MSIKGETMVILQDFPSGSVVKSLPANEGDMGSIPGPHAAEQLSPVYHGYWACVLEHESHNPWTHVPQLLMPTCPRACALQQEEPLQWEACAPQIESSPHSLQEKKSLCSNEDPA